MVSGTGNPSRSRHPVVSVHRMGVPWETRVLDISRGKRPRLNGDSGVIALICLSYDLRCLLLRPGYVPAGALVVRGSGKHDCFDRAERRLVRNRVVDRLFRVVLLAETGNR